MALVAAVLRKDRKATAEFVARFADDLYSYVRGRLAPHYDQVDDLVQEVFLAAWKSLPQYRGDGSLISWVMGIARHKAEDYYRQHLRVPDSLDEGDAIANELPSSIDLQQGFDQEDLRQTAQRVMHHLPEQYRLVLLWKYWDKASTREIAEKTGKTEKAIERLLARARTEFRQRWNRG
jgi:RNA polymerase sigma-70 factor, ECF subfamily